MARDGFGNKTMQEDFHYYATYLAAYLAGYSHEESLDLCYSAQFVDCCSRSLLAGIHGPVSAATTQLQLELMEAGTDKASRQNMTRIWASFHFLPFDLYAKVGRGTRNYRDKYRLICDTNSDLLVRTVELAGGRPIPAAGIAMHVLADTWAHRYFAGTPSLVINNTGFGFRELIPEGNGFREEHVSWHHNVAGPDNPEKGKYTNTVFRGTEYSVMNLGHGRAGHFPDYSYARYRYLPAWGQYAEVLKDNPADYWQAFCQMVYALRFLRGESASFEKDTYDTVLTEPLREEICQILECRQRIACREWKAIGEKLSGCEIPDFTVETWTAEYKAAMPERKNNTRLGQFILAAQRQKSMVTGQIARSGNCLAGKPIGFEHSGFASREEYMDYTDHDPGKTPLHSDFPGQEKSL